MCVSHIFTFLDRPTFIAKSIIQTTIDENQTKQSMAIMKVPCISQKQRRLKGIGVPPEAQVYRAQVVWLWIPPRGY